MPLYLKLLAAATVEALLLCGLSRLLFLAAFRLFGDPGHSRGGRLWHVFRAPGNLVHELSHAIILLACGFRVQRLRLSAADPNGRGEVVAKGRWMAAVPKSCAWALASVAPVAGGMAALLLLMRLLEADVRAPTFRGATMGEAVVAGAFSVLSHIRWGWWPTYLLLYLALSVGSELAPSDRDVRASLPGMLGAAAVACLAGAFFYAAPVGAPARAWFDGIAPVFLKVLIKAQELALALCASASLALFVPMVLRDGLSADGPRPAAAHPRAKAQPRRSTRPRPAARRRSTTRPATAGSEPPRP